MKPVHDESTDDVEIVSVIPAAPGWALASLYRDADAPELTVHPIAAWALVAPARVVVPLVAVGGAIEPELPSSSSLILNAIVEPGLRAVVRKSATCVLRIATEPGSWVAGLQDLQLDGEARVDVSASEPQLAAHDREPRKSE